MSSSLFLETERHRVDHKKNERSCEHEIAPSLRGRCSQIQEGMSANHLPLHHSFCIGLQVRADAAHSNACSPHPHTIQKSYECTHPCKHASTQAHAHAHALTCAQNEEKISFNRKSLAAIDRNSFYTGTIHEDQADQSSHARQRARQLEYIH